MRALFGFVDALMDCLESLVRLVALLLFTAVTGAAGLALMGLCLWIVWSGVRDLVG